jgi:hypothetical protein
MAHHSRHFLGGFHRAGDGPGRFVDIDHHPALQPGAGLTGRADDLGRLFDSGSCRATTATT